MCPRRLQFQAGRRRCAGDGRLSLSSHPGRLRAAPPAGRDPSPPQGAPGSLAVALPASPSQCSGTIKLLFLCAPCPELLAAPCPPLSPLPPLPARPPPCPRPRPPAQQPYRACACVSCACACARTRTVTHADSHDRIVRAAAHVCVRARAVSPSPLPPSRPGGTPPLSPPPRFECRATCVCVRARARAPDC